MNFTSEEGQPLKEILETKIKAFIVLKDSNININTFNDNGYWSVQCVDVIEELKWLLSLVKEYSLEKYKPYDLIKNTLISKSNRLIRGFYDKNLCNNENLKKPLENYVELNNAINYRMNWVISNAMSKEKNVEKVIKKKVSQSIDTNTKYTIISFLIAGGIAFLTNLNFAELFPCWKYSVLFQIIFNSCFAFVCMVTAWFVFKKFKDLK